MENLLKSWINKASKYLTNWRATWQQQQALQCNHHSQQTFHSLHTHATSSHHSAPSTCPQSNSACWPEQVYFDTDSHSIRINNWCSACISHNITNFIDTPQPISSQIKGFWGLKHWTSKLAPSDGNGRMTRAWSMTTPSLKKDLKLIYLWASIS